MSGPGFRPETTGGSRGRGGIVARVDPFDRPVATDVATGDEEAVYRNRARRLGLSYTSYVDLGPNAYSDVSVIDRGMFAMGADAGAPAYLAPDETLMPAIGHWLSVHPSARARLAVATPTTIRAALRHTGERRYASAARDKLESLDPSLSARRTVTLAQVVAACLAVAAIAAALVLAPVATLLIVNLAAAVFFLGVTFLRFAAAGHVPDHPPRPPLATGSDELPVYTVLVPLLHEAHIVGQLLAGLDGLDWPRDRLDIKLIVEEDDAATQAAATGLAGGSPYEVIVVPAGVGPRTKPMALQYAMTFARGAFVTIYDAEDRPHPGQLREAYATFQRHGKDLGCLQAPIVIDNTEAGLIALLFAVEYATVFDGILPALARMRLPLPLGGTSNHFRRAAIDRVGGWDPYNVTEDADLGIRLARFGYRAATITLPTREEAPAAIGPWMRQRTRWFKGWMQTWLVSSRHPVRLCREVGIRQVAGFNLVGLGMIVSAIAHPVFLATPILLTSDPFALWQGGDPVIAAMVGLNIFNLVAGYVAMAILARRTLAMRNRDWAISALVWLPLYWLLMGFACLRALVQLVRRPHYWEKTPHVGQRIARRQPVSRVLRPAGSGPDWRGASTSGLR